MKYSTFIIKVSLVVLLLFLMLSVVHAQHSRKDKMEKKITLTKNLIESQNFVFIPQTMIPSRSGSMPITSYYELVVLKDTLISNLPFFGRAYNAPVLPSDNGFDFTSTKFDYAIKNEKKSGWYVDIRPKGQQVKQFSLRIFDNGSAYLNVTSLNRDPISYNGYISEGSHKKL